MKTRDDIRNIAIIAHVDHGKTTLVNELLKQSDTLDEHVQIEDRALDSNAIERERGITILSKNTAVRYGDKQIDPKLIPKTKIVNPESRRTSSSV